MMFEFAEEVERLADIKVAGIGGAGGNAVGRMVEAGLTGVEFLAVNTDLQALKNSPAHNAMQIGAQLTKGLGSGGDPSRGRAAAEEDREAIAAALGGADMVFVTAGMGGGTGTGAAPVIADIARNQGALTVGIVTKPFQFEGSVRMQQALDGIERLRDAVDTLIIIPNQRLLEVVPPSTSMREAFRIADNVLYEATRGIYEIISRHDHVNLDFADVRTVMKGMGEAMMGTGRAEGENRAIEAAKAAISSPLLENVDIAGSQAVLVNVIGREVGLQDTAAAMQYIQDAAGPQAHVIFGYGTDDAMGDTLQVTVIATGFHSRGAAAAARLARAATASLHGSTVAAVEPAPATPAPEETEAPVATPLEAAPETGLDQPVEADEDLPVESGMDEAPGIETEIEPEAELAPDVEPEAEWHEAPAAHEADPALEESADAAARSAAGQEEATGLRAMAAEAGGAGGFAGGEGFARASAPHADGGPVETPTHRPAWSAPTVTRRVAAEDDFLTRRPAPARGETESQRPETAQGNERFLSPAGTRDIAEVDVPDGETSRTLSRGTSTGLGPDRAGTDLSEPAYTRKYMD